MRFDLREMAMRANPGRRKRAVTIRDIAPPSILATDLYQAAYKPVLALVDRYAALAASEYERTLSALITDSGDDLTNIFERMGQELSALVLLLRPGLRDWCVRIEKYQRGKWRGAVLAASKVDIETLIGPQDVAQTLGDILNWNVNLVTDVGQQAKAKIASSVFAGLRARSPARDVAKQIQEATGFARDRSLRIASHQLSTLSSSLARERREQAGLGGYTYRHSAKKHPRLEHLARNGNLYSSDPTLVGRVVEGKTILPDLPANDRAGVRPGCGCREAALLIFD
jgi:hypothetical protein